MYHEPITDKLVYLVCALGHNLRREEGVLHSSCLKGNCVLPFTCPVNRRCKTRQLMLIKEDA